MPFPLLHAQHGVPRALDGTRYVFEGGVDPSKFDGSGRAASRPFDSRWAVEALGNQFWPGGWKWCAHIVRENRSLFSAMPVIVG
jgi:hypothetical protein